MHQIAYWQKVRETENSTELYTAGYFSIYHPIRETIRT